MSFLFALLRGFGAWGLGFRAFRAFGGIGWLSGLLGLSPKLSSVGLLELRGLVVGFRVTI